MTFEMFRTVFSTHNRVKYLHVYLNHNTCWAIMHVVVPADCVYVIKIYGSLHYDYNYICLCINRITFILCCCCCCMDTFRLFGTSIDVITQAQNVYVPNNQKLSTFTYVFLYQNWFMTCWNIAAPVRWKVNIIFDLTIIFTEPIQYVYKLLFKKFKPRKKQLDRSIQENFRVWRDINMVYKL